MLLELHNVLYYKTQRWPSSQNKPQEGDQDPTYHIWVEILY